jgi:3'-phosphoadenosine 5'-phosphosulfate sulfotransferase (PAPS reductase)/FAD synthetase
MLCTLVNDGIPFDFAYYTNLDNEIEGEFEFVKYYTRYVLNVPLVIGRSQNTADEFFYNKGRWPSQRARWCTDLMKLDPLRGLFKKFFHDPMDAGQHVDIVQFLGMQAFQSPGRAKMSPDAKPSMLSVPKPYINVENTHCEVWESGQFKGKPKKINVANWPVDRKTGKFIGMEKWHEMSPDLKIMRVFDMLPIFYLDHEDDLDILENNGIIRNPSEIRWGRHGCVICPFANFRYYHEMHVNYPKIYKMCVKRRDLTSQKQLESGSLKAVWTQFGKNKFTEEMAKFGYHDDQGKFHHYTKDDPPF